MVTAARYTPIALYDSVDFMTETDALPQQVSAQFHNDYRAAKQFLLAYQHNPQTFKRYRSEIERFSQWCWFFAYLPFAKIEREDIENYIRFCQKPPNAWIAIKQVARFIEKEGKRIPSPAWRPFVATQSKAQHQRGQKVQRAKYSMSTKSIREVFTALSRFYQHLVEEQYLLGNPVVRVKQKNRFFPKVQGNIKIRRISDLQWDYVIETAEKLADDNPSKHERTLFIISILYGMYLRISELAASDRWEPAMNDFKKDYEENWWFTTTGKGNKQRRIAVSQAVLQALVRWRQHLECLTALPLQSENTPLITGRNVNKPIGSTRQIRNIVQLCFDHAVCRMQGEGFMEQAEELKQATVHWLRHTGISDDVKHRPREHVRDDAGHSSSQITDHYIDIDLNERHASAKEKVIKK